MAVERAETWAFTDHVCATCFGRIVRRAVRGRDGNTLVFRCTTCGALGEVDVKSICSCNAKHNNGRSLGLRCKPNPQRSLTNPAEFVAMER